MRGGNLAIKHLASPPVLATEFHNPIAEGYVLEGPAEHSTAAIAQVIVYTLTNAVLDGRIQIHLLADEKRNGVSISVERLSGGLVGLDENLVWKNRPKSERDRLSLEDHRGPRG